MVGACSLTMMPGGVERSKGCTGERYGLKGRAARLIRVLDMEVKGSEKDLTGSSIIV